MARTKRTIVYLGTDHAAFALKEELKRYLQRSGYRVIDMGAYDEDPSDYPDFIIPAVEAAVGSKKKAVAVVLGGSGIGECIAANKVPGARAALAYDTFTARVTRAHNDSNVLCLGSRTVTGDARLAKRLLRIWLETRFSGASRHARRIKKITRYERRKKGSRRSRSHPAPEGPCVHES